MESSSSSSKNDTTSTEEKEISIVVTFRGNAFQISVLPSSSLAEFQARIEELMNVPVERQKLIYKGKKTSRSTGESKEETVEDVGLKDGLKVMLVGGTKEEVGGMQKEENEVKHRERIDRERRAKPQAKLRSTTPATTQTQYKFLSIKPHSFLPHSDQALAFLTRLADDPAIKHVMQSHKFTVGLLTEFAPHEHPDKLGLNTNAGQVISLRIRTNEYDGFRPYLDARKVLIHELTHNVWSDHDNNFKELNSRLGREVIEYERNLSANTHTLSSSGPSFSDSFSSVSSELEREATSYILGGADQQSSSSAASNSNETAEDRRRRILEATMARLKKEEEELEGACDTYSTRSGRR